MKDTTKSTFVNSVVKSLISVLSIGILSLISVASVNASLTLTTSASTIWVNNGSNDDALDWSGSENTVQGGVHSNAGIKLGGSDNQISGGTYWVAKFDNGGDNNSFNPTPQQTTVQAWPHEFNLSDYQPGGAAALAAGNQYFDQSQTCSSNDKWEQDVQGSQLPAGLYWVPCDVVVSASDLTGEVTIISTGKIEVSGSDQSVLTAHTDRILLWSEYQGDDAIKLSGSDSEFYGLIAAPNGRIEISGSDSTLSCGLAADQIKLNGSKLSFTDENCINNTAPVAEDLSISGNEDQDINFTLSAFDEDADPLTYTILTQPSNGTLSGSAPSLVYTPNENFNGSDVFTYQVNDGELDSEIATVSITVNSINDTPVADSQTLTTEEDTTLDIVLNGSDIENDVLTYTVQIQPNNGVLSGAGENLIYTPNANFNGTDSFSYLVNDGQADSAQATVDITISPVNDLPIILPISAQTVSEDSPLTLNITASDVDGNALVYAVIAQPTNGEVTGTGPEFTYTPSENFAGSDNFSVQVSDGIVTSSIEVISINVENVNDVPLADSQDVVTDEDTAVNISLSGSDIDGDTLNYVIQTQTTNGVLTGTDQELIYTPNENYFGTDSFTFVTNDGQVNSEPATVSITVSAINDTPEAIALSAELNEDESVVITLVSNDVDTAQEQIAFSLLEMPANGLISGDFPALTYTPNANFNGSDSFTYVAMDGLSDSEVATVSITVAAINDMPIVEDQAFTIDKGQALNLTLTSIDVDVTDVSTFTIVSNPVNGVITGTSPNFVYTPQADFSGSDSFTYVANDGTVDSNLATIAITVIITDSDNDGVPDELDAFPNDAAESSDLDNDGIGDNADPDRDGDGVDNTIDVFPNDSTESADLDSDGIGDNVDPDRDGDGVLNADDFFPDDPDSSTVPTVTITTPESLITVGSSPITVTGTIDDPTARLTVNGVEIVPTGGTYTADVALEEGLNNIVVRGIDAKNHEGLATITVSLDKTPPYVTIASLEQDQTVYSDKIAVGGLVNDIVRGTVTEDDAIVRVNGQLATVTNRSYLAEDIPLTVGENTIEVVASDAVGNVGNAFVTINYQVQTKNIIELVAGQSQTTEINTPVAAPLQVRLLSDGLPLADKTVVFRVIKGDGLLQAGIEEGANGAIVKTDVNGIAGVSFNVGSRAGVGNHRVRARAVGFEGEVIFHANASYGPGARVGVIAGNNQRGSVRQPLPSPLVLAVTDTGTNLIPDADIEWKVTTGTGTFANGETIFLSKTDKDGRASAQFILGPEEGLDQQRVTATLVGTNASSGFTLSGFMPGDPGQTSIKGVVLDNQDRPLPDVSIRVDGVNRQAITDAQGQFTIAQSPVGPVHLLVEGNTTSVEGEWPTLSYNIVTVPGVINPLASPIYLVELDTENAQMVGAEDVEFTLPDVPGFKLKVGAGSVTFPDGSNTGMLSVTAVNANKVPMPPPNGMQPQLIMTLQPHGAMFDEPAELTLPNVDGHKPGAEVEMYSYDHDLEEFVTIGLGTVARDGTTITSNPGVGVVKAGWHCGSPPDENGCAAGGPANNGSCLVDPECQIETVVALDGGECGPGSRQTVCTDRAPITLREAQTPNDCKINTCGGNVPDDNDKPIDKCSICKSGISAGMSVNVAGPLLVIKGQAYDYNASSTDGSLPEGELAWLADGGVVSGSGTNVSVTFNTPSTAIGDLKSVTSTCNSTNGALDVCVVDAPAVVPPSVNSISYPGTVGAPRFDNSWGEVAYNLFLDSKISSYYDSASNSWKAKLIKVEKPYTIFYRLLPQRVKVGEELTACGPGTAPKVNEASAAAATALNCQQMLFDLTNRAEVCEPEWFILEAVRKHELRHVDQLEDAFNIEFPAFKNSIESISIPHFCGLNSAGAKASIISSNAFRSALGVAGDNAKIYIDQFVDAMGNENDPGLIAAEFAVINPVIAAIKAKANLPANAAWPAACK